MAAQMLGDIVASIILGALICVGAISVILLLWASAEEKKEREARDVINDWRNKHGDY